MLQDSTATPNPLLRIQFLVVKAICVQLELNIKLFAHLDNTNHLLNNQLVITVLLDSIVMEQILARVLFVHVDITAQ